MSWKNVFNAQDAITFFAQPVLISDERNSDMRIGLQMFYLKVITRLPLQRVIDLNGSNQAIIELQFKEC